MKNRLAEMLKRANPPKAPAADEKPPRGAILITYQANGQVTVEGPIQDRMLCFAMLKMAEVSLVSMVLADNRTAPPPAPIVPAVAGQEGNA